MKGSEKQIKYANDLIAEMKKNVVFFESKGKGERRVDQKKFLSLITDETDAGDVIEIITNWNAYADAVNNRKAVTWEELVANRGEAMKNAQQGKYA